MIKLSKHHKRMDRYINSKRFKKDFGKKLAEANKFIAELQKKRKLPKNWREIRITI